MDKLLLYLDKFLYSKIYLIFLGIIIYLSWFFESSVWGMALLLSIASIILITKEDVSPIIPILLMIIFATAKSDILDTGIPILASFGSLTAMSFIVHLVLYPQKYKLGKLFYPLLAVSIALILGGVTKLTPKEYANGLIFIFTLGILMLVLYIFFFNNIKFSSKTKDLPQYFSMMLMVAGYVIFFEMITEMIQLKLPLLEIIRSIMDIGWTTRNGIACMLLVCFPACFYLGMNSKYFGWMYYLFGFILIVAILLTSSRAGVVAVGIVAPITIVYTGVKSKNKINVAIGFVIFAIIAGIYINLCFEEVIEVFGKMWEDGINSSGRTDLYKEAFELFKRNIIFGAGLGYIGEFFPVPPWCIYWYHSTLFQIMGSLGLVGIISYGFFYIRRLLILLSNYKNPFNIFMALAVLGFELHSLLDVGVFSPFPFLFSVIMISIIVEINNNTQNENAIIVHKVIKKSYPKNNNYTV